MISTMFNPIIILLLVIRIVKIVQSDELNGDIRATVRNDSEPNNIGVTTKLPKINLKNNLECQMANSNETGIIQFLSECPALNKSSAAAKINKICDYEICSDLVCCPSTIKSRLKKVCSHVDAPHETLYSRLARNQKCTVKELNLTGVYQKRCAYAKRHPHLKSQLKNVCNDVSQCKNWYCCPIEDDDLFQCTASQIQMIGLINMVGPKCVDSKSGRQGRCENFNDIINNDLDFCGTNCCNNFYCVPDIDSSIIETSSMRECSSYTKYLSKETIEVEMDPFRYISCTDIWSLIELYREPQFPHIAALGYKSDNKFEWNCGGSLISDQFVLTAAHCLTDSKLGNVAKVRLGVVNLQIDENSFDCPEEFDVAKVIPFPEYTPTLVYNDIGLIQLVDRVKFNAHIRPICLPSSSDLPTSFKTLGWGALGTYEDKTVKLMLADQEIFTHEECQEYYENNKNRKLNRGVLNDTLICAGSKDSVQGTCAGDSGGPLFGEHEIHEDLYYIYGVNSFGTVCGFENNPGLYTKVLPYVKWIEEIVWSN